MATTTIDYQLHKTIAANKTKMVGSFPTELAAKTHAQRSKEREEEEYRILMVVTTTSVLDIFSVPAYIPPLEEIADDIIGYADGSATIDWGEDYEKLTAEQQEKVKAFVNAEIDTCAHCGWHFKAADLETGVQSGDLVCYSCAADEQEDADEEDEEDED